MQTIAWYFGLVSSLQSDKYISIVHHGTSYCYFPRTTESKDYRQVTNESCLCDSYTFMYLSGICVYCQNLNQWLTFVIQYFVKYNFVKKMFSSGPNYTKLKTHLRLAMNRLKLLEKKKAELTQKSRREIADFIQAGKYERAKIRVEQIIREDYLVEAMEVVEMYCDLLLARFGLITQMKELDDGIAEAIASIMWVTPRLQADCQELKVIYDMLASKYGIQFAEGCRNESDTRISQKLKHKLSIQAPPKLLVEKYLIEIAKTYDIPYEPDPQVMREESDGLLIDLSDKNNLGGIPQPPGFIGFPQAPHLPHQPAFNYPPLDNTSGGFAIPNNPSAPDPNVPYGAPFSYNIPPGAESKESNADYIASLPPPYTSLPPEDNNQNKEQPKPLPRSKLSGGTYPDLPELPSVPSDDTLTPPTNNDDIDFDDLTRRFEELKKRK